MSDNTWATFSIVVAVGIIAGTSLGFLREVITSPSRDKTGNPVTNDVSYPTNVPDPLKTTSVGGKRTKRKTKRNK